MYVRCARFVKYEGCTVAMAVEVVGLMMFLRIKAIYPNQRWITMGLGTILLFETAMNAWLISRGQRTSDVAFCPCYNSDEALPQAVMHNPNSGVRGDCNVLHLRTRTNTDMQRVV